MYTIGGPLYKPGHTRNWSNPMKLVKLHAVLLKYRPIDPVQNWSNTTNRSIPNTKLVKYPGPSTRWSPPSSSPSPTTRADGHIKLVK